MELFYTKLEFVSQYYSIQVEKCYFYGMRKLFTSVFLLVFSLTLSAQSPERQSVYKYKLGLDIPIGIITLGTGGTGLLLHKKKQPLTLEEVNALKVTDVNKFDRSAIYRHSKGCSVSSDVFQYTSMVAPALLFIDKDIRKDYSTVLPIWIETFALTAALTTFTKEIAQRKRPYVYNPNTPIGDKLSKDAKSSFFSGHTAVTASSLFFIAQVYSDYHPDSKLKPLFWTTAAVVPAMEGLLRYGAGKHYFTDVIVAYAIGATVGILVPYLHRRKF
jgi:hypothetical protein